MKKFTLIELLVVVAIIGILASLLLPSLGRARTISKSSVCLNNLKSLSTAIYLYSDDNEDYVPAATNVGTPWDDLLISYDGANRTLDNGGGYKDDEHGTSLKLYHCPENPYKNDAGLITRSYSINAGVNQSLPGFGWNGTRGLSMSGYWVVDRSTDPWSMRIGEINDTSTAIMLNELETITPARELILGQNGGSAADIGGVVNAIYDNPDKHGKSFYQNYLFADGHVSLHYLQSLSAGSGINLFDVGINDARGTFFDCQN